ncbi:MAG: hypothetical protein FWC40_06735 [Proteobacteria bacterium]|nr:hypothetical protein [Pseudomonadota bacterium]
MSEWRLSCFVLACLMHLWVGHAWADAADEGGCQAEVAVEGVSVAEHRLMAPVRLVYVLHHETDCRLRVDAVTSWERVCEHPTVTTRQAGEGQGQARSESRVAVTCRYRRAGFFYTQPVRMVLERDQVSTRVALPLLEPPVHVVLYDIEDVRLPEDAAMILAWRKSLPKGLQVLIVVFLLGLSGWIVMRHRLGAGMADAEEAGGPALPPLEVFHAKLAQLLQIEPVDVETHKVYHDVLSTAIRQYLADRLGVSAMETTTGKLRVQLLNASISGTSVAGVLRILAGSDLVKFSWVPPSENANLMLLRDAGHVVNLIEAEISAVERQKTEREGEVHAFSKECVAPAQPLLQVVETGAQVEESRDALFTAEEAAFAYAPTQHLPKAVTGIGAAVQEESRDALFTAEEAAFAQALTQHLPKAVAGIGKDSSHEVHPMSDHGSE